MIVRRYMRVPLPIPVRFRTSEMTQPELARIRDISWGGVFLCWKQPLPPGTRIIIEFLLSDDSVAIEIWGSVVRAELGQDNNTLGMGIKFDDLDDETRSSIQKMVVSYIEPIFQRFKAK